MADETPPRDSFVITLPGVTDVLVVPPAEDVNLKRERLSRFALQAAASPVPHSLRWIPQLINWLDDAQDILITALILGKPILRRLPTRILPGLGMALLANDLLNLFTNMLSFPLNPRVRKVDFLNDAKRAIVGKGGFVRAAEAFLLPGKIKWIPFALQAGQVIYTFTGWGLRLGAVMGTVSETFWGALRALQGDRVVIQPPPQSDPVMKAASFLSRASYWNLAVRCMNEVEIQILTLAMNVSAGLVGAPSIPAGAQVRLEAMADTTMAIHDFRSAATIQALRDAGYPPLAQQRVAAPTQHDNPSYGDASRVAIALEPDLDARIAEILNPHVWDFPYGLALNEFTQWAWDVFGGGYDFIVPSTSPMERMLGIALETGVVPPFIYHPIDGKETQRLRDADLVIRDEQPCYNILTRPSEWPRWAHAAPLYPPPSEDPNVQLAHWCAIGLALFCGRKILLPIQGEPPHDPGCYDANTEIIGFYENQAKMGLASMQLAAVLVWGVAYFRGVTPHDPPTPSDTKKPSLCRASGTRLPSLSGQSPEIEPFRAVLDAFPDDLTTTARLGNRGRPWETFKGRDWLDQYLRDHDPRRATQPPLPDPNIMPTPDDTA